MSVDVIKSAFLYLLLILIQVLVLNYIHLFQCATPLLYIYITIGMPRNVNKWLSLLISFVVGLIVDIFSNTPGVGAASATLIALIQPYLLELFVNRESPDDLKPTIRTLGVSRYIYFSLPLVVLFCLSFFTLEAFNFFNWVQWLKCVGGSVTITFIFILVIENIRKR